MVTGSCSRESDTIRAAWGERPGAEVDPELAAHIRECPACAEVAWLAETFRAERDAARAEARPPSAGIVWWRAQRRAREEAARRAARPIALIHAIALGCTAAAALAVLSAGVSPVTGWLTTLGPLFSEGAGTLGGFPRVATLSLGALLLLAPALVLAPIALYLAFSEK